MIAVPDTRDHVYRTIGANGRSGMNSAMQRVELPLPGQCPIGAKRHQFAVDVAAVRVLTLAKPVLLLLLPWACSQAAWLVVTTVGSANVLSMDLMFMIPISYT